MDGCAASFHRDDGIEHPDGRLEGLEVLVLVRKDAEVVVIHP